MAITGVAQPVKANHGTFQLKAQSAGQPLPIETGVAKQPPAGLPGLAANSFKPLSLLRFSAAKPFTYQPEQNIVFDLKRRAERFPNEVSVQVARKFAINDGTPQSLTNKELYEGSLKVARVLKEQYNIKPGDKVATIDTNTPEFFQLFFGALALGATVVPVNILPLADKVGAKEKLAHMLKLSDCKAVFIGKVIASNPEFESLLELKKLEPLLKPFNRFILKNTMPSLSRAVNLLPGTSEKLRHTKAKLQTLAMMLNNLPAGMKIVLPKDTDNFEAIRQAKPLSESQLVLNPAPDQGALLLFTSGTTSMPKGVPITHASLVHNTESLKGFAQELTANDKQLLLLPMFHIYGLSVFLAGLSSRTQNILLPSTAEAARNPQKLLDSIAEEQITFWPTLPKILQRVLEQPDAAEKLKTIKVVVSGGEKLLEEQYQGLKQVNPNAVIWEGYGMTESGILFVNKADQYGHVGKRVSPHIEIQLRGSESSAQGIGEIWVKGPSITKTYLGVSEDQMKDVFKGDGWLNTGDLGRYDDQGNLKIVGRSKEIIKRAGEILAPEDFDIRMKQFLPIRDAITFAYTPKGTQAEKVVSIVLLKPEVGNLSEAALKVELQKQVKAGDMAGRYVPDYIVPMTGKEFPEGFVSVVGKKQYKVCREYLNHNGFPKTS